MIYYGANNYPIYYGANEATIYYGNELIYPTTISGISISSSVSIKKAGGSKTVRLASESDWEILVDPAATWITSISPTGGTSGRSQITITAAENTGTTALTTTITARTTDLAYSATCQVTQIIGLNIKCIDHLGNTNNAGHRAGNDIYTMDTGFTEITSFDFDLTDIKTITVRGWDVSYFRGIFPSISIEDMVVMETCSSIVFDCKNSVEVITYGFGGDRHFSASDPLTSITISNCSALKTIYLFARYHPNLTTIHFGDLSNITYMNPQFDQNQSLINIYIDSLPNSNIDSSWQFNVLDLSVASLNSIIAALPTASGSYTLTLGATNLAKLSQAEKDVAINKGWNLN